MLCLVCLRKAVRQVSSSAMQVALRMVIVRSSYLCYARGGGGSSTTFYFIKSMLLLLSFVMQARRVRQSWGRSLLTLNRFLLSLAIRLINWTPCKVELQTAATFQIYVLVWHSQMLQLHLEGLYIWPCLIILVSVIIKDAPCPHLTNGLLVFIFLHDIMLNAFCINIIYSGIIVLSIRYIYILYMRIYRKTLSVSFSTS